MIRRLLFLFAFIFMISSVYSVTTIGSLPYTISAPGEYNISGNLSSTGHAITITTQNVSLNCEGYTMTGDEGSSDYGIVINGDAYDYNNITNCNFNNFGYGFYLYEGDYTNFSNLNINTTTGGIYFHYGAPDYNYFTNITINRGFDFYTGTTNEFLGRIYFNNVSDGNGKYLISYISTPINIDGWTNISGIYLYDSDNSVIQNLNINGEDKYAQAVFLHTYHSNNVTFTNISVTNYRIGFFVSGWFNDQINFFNLNLSNGYYGLYHIGSYINSNNISLNNYTMCILKTGYSLTINNSYFNNCNYLININQQAGNTYIYNTIYSNSTPISWNGFNTASQCNNIFQNVTNETGKYFVYSNQSINIDGWTNISSIYLCNADNSSLTNLNYNGITRTNTFFQVLFTDYSNFTNLNFTNYIDGIYLYKSNYNFLNNTNTSNNSQYGIHIYQSDYNTLTNFNTSFNSYGVYLTQGSDYNTLNNFNSHNNGWSGVTTFLSTNNYNNYSNFNVYNNGFGSGLYLQSGTGSIAKNFTSYKNGKGVTLDSSSNYQILDNFTTYNNTGEGIYITSSSNYNNLSNFNSSYNTARGLMFITSNYNIFNNFTIYKNTQQGIYISSGKNNTMNNFSSYNNSASGIQIQDSNNTISNFNIYNNSFGIYLYTNADTNYFSNGTSINNTNYNVRVEQQSSTNAPNDNIFYNNYLGNISKIYSNNWTNINYFNSSLSGYNIGNYWNDLACYSYTILGTYKVCTIPTNYTLNSTNNIYDFAPLTEGINYISNCTNLNASGFTYYLTANILNSVTSACMNISANNVTLDCGGYTIDGNDATSNGIYLYRSSSQTTNVTIKNCIVSDWTSNNIQIFRSNGNVFQNLITNSSAGYGIFFDGNDNRVNNITIKDNTGQGFFMSAASRNNLTEINSLNNGQYGLYIQSSLNNSIYNSTFNNNTQGDFKLYASSNSYCNQLFLNVTDSNGKYHIYSNQSMNIDGWTNISSINLCNADMSIIKNLNFSSNYNQKGSAIYLVLTDNSNLSNLDIGKYFNGLYLETCSNNNLNNFTSHNNSNYALYLFASNNNNISNFTNYGNSQTGISIWSSTSNLISNFTVYKNMYGVEIYGGNRNNLNNFTSYNNTQHGMFLWSGANNHILSNFVSYYNSKGINLGSGGGSVNNTFFNGTLTPNSNYNVEFSTTAAFPVVNNTFYNNHLGNVSKIYSNNWSMINYFNSSLSGYNIGNYWNDLGVCSSYQTIGIYKVCLNPANYTINSTNNIYDFAPLIIIPEYISPTPRNNTNLGGTSFTIRVEDTQGVSTWFNATINGVNYPLTNISSTEWEYSLTTEDFVGVTNITFNVSYAGNGIMETRVFTFYPNHASEAFPVHTLLSGLITIMLILIGGFYLNKK